MVQKVAVKRQLRLGFTTRRLENSFCQPSSKWVPFSNEGRIRQRKERDGLRVSLAVPPLPLRLLGYGKSLPFKNIASKTK